MREIHFFEAHTCHRDFEDAERQIEEDKEIARRFFKKLCIPFIFNKRPEWDKFAGAFYTISIDAFMPSGRTLQLGSIHHYKDNFSKPYNITFEDVDGKREYCHQTTYGMSERVLGAIVGIHGDNKGIILPPAVAPIKVVIIPIIFKGKEEKVLKGCQEVERLLKEESISCHIDTREDTPGSKFYDWELRGVPLRAEIGPKEIDNKTVVLARRDTGERVEVKIDRLIEEVKRLFDEIEENLYSRAKELLEKSMVRIHNLEDAKKYEKCILEIPWCGKEDCALRIEEELDVKTLGEAVDEEKVEGRCPVCMEEAVSVARFAKTY